MTSTMTASPRSRNEMRKPSPAISNIAYSRKHGSQPIASRTPRSLSCATPHFEHRQSLPIFQLAGRRFFAFDRANTLRPLTPCPPRSHVPSFQRACTSYFTHTSRSHGPLTRARGTTFTIFLPLTAAAGIHNGTFHDFRKTAITNWFYQALSIYDVMRLAGHSKYETTYRFYLQVKDGLIDRARRATAYTVSQELLQKCCSRGFEGDNGKG